MSVTVSCHRGRGALSPHVPPQTQTLPLVVLTLFVLSHWPLLDSPHTTQRRRHRDGAQSSTTPLAYPSLSLSLLQDNLPVVVLHGLLGSSRNFRGWASALHERLEKPRRILVPDLRNHGQSPHVGGMSYRYGCHPSSLPPSLPPTSMEAYAALQETGSNQIKAVGPVTHIHDLSPPSLPPSPAEKWCKTCCGCWTRRALESAWW